MHAAEPGQTLRGMAGGTPTSSASQPRSEVSSIGPLRSTPASASIADPGAGTGLSSMLAMAEAEAGRGQSRGVSPSKARASEPDEHISRFEYGIYYIVLFFAFWLGSHRFDQDGDGDFDPADVRAYLRGENVAKKNFKQSKTLSDIERFRLRSSKSNLQEGPCASPASPTSSASGSPTLGHRIFDSNGDGKVTVTDMFVSKVEGESVEAHVFHNLRHGQRIPYFVILQTLFCFLVWLIMAFVVANEAGDISQFLVMQAGADSFAPGVLDLRLATSSDRSCQSVRSQVYRWLTYQWTHVGVVHAINNCIMLLVMGIPLEGLHGSLRMALMFNTGVLGGALCYIVSDAHTPVVGMSGGCYALIGLHVADLLINWHQKKFRLPTAFLIIFVVTFEVVSYELAVGSETASHTAHVGGVVAGILIGVLVGRNLHVNRSEIAMMAASVFIGFGLVIFCIVWLLVHPSPQSVWEAQGWCWLRQVFIPDVDGTKYVCVKCGTQDCIDHFVGPGYRMLPVSLSSCLRGGGFHYEG